MMKTILLNALSVSTLAFALGTPASAQQTFCPEEGIPYNFTLLEDVLMINHAYHRAFCQKGEGTEYECLEKWPGDPDVSVYTVHAKVLENGDLGFWATDSNPDGAPWVVRTCE